MRSVKHCLAVVATAAVAALAPVVVAPAAADASVVSQQAASTAIGSWTATVSIPGKPDSVVTLEFDPGHLGTITGPAGADGHPLYAGLAVWSSTGQQLSFQVVHPLPAADGTLLGIIHGTQQGTVDGDTFHSTGQSYLYKPDGTVAGPNSVTITGVRAATR